MRRLLLCALPVLFVPAASAGPERYHDYHREHNRAYAVEPAQLVRFWYQKFLRRRVPDPQGEFGWVQSLRQGNPPEMVLASILSSEEYYANAGNTPQGFVRVLYGDLVGRNPTKRELFPLVRRTQLESRSDIAYSLLQRYPLSWRYSEHREHEEHESDYDYRRPRDHRR
jgi:hypothetical protein